MFKYIVVGAGLSGVVVAERISSQLNEKVLVGVLWCYMVQAQVL